MLRVVGHRSLPEIEVEVLRCLQRAEAHGYSTLTMPDHFGDQLPRFVKLGPAAADLESADLNRRAVRNARQTVLLVDHTKFAAASLCKIVDWELVARIVTNRAPTPEWMDFLGALTYLREMVAMVSTSEDFAEGVRAFLEKRKPDW